MSFFGYAYYLEEEGKLNAVSIDNGDGCVEPSTATIESGTYTPLARPLFIYVSVESANTNPTVQEYVEYYLDEAAFPLIADTGYALLDPAAYELSLERFNARETGSLFIDGAGKTVLEVLRGE
jgi:phosphate transport system substrate-binding protein